MVVVYFIPFSQVTVITPIADLLFMVSLVIAVATPIIKVKQWNQAGILAVLLLLVLGNLLFYLSIAGLVKLMPQVGLYLGFYLILAMVFIMARRVVPFFIEKGVGYEVKINNWLWLDILSLIFFGAFAVSDIVWLDQGIVALLAVLLFVLHTLRLIQWHTPGIWKKPLLWVLYFSYGFITLGFALKAGAFACSASWDTTDIIVIGADDADMALAVNRIFDLQGGAVVSVNGKIEAELSMPVFGILSELPIKQIAEKTENIKNKLSDLGVPFPNPLLSLIALTGAAIPFLRICEEGMVNLKNGEAVGIY